MGLLEIKPLEQGLGARVFCVGIRNNLKHQRVSFKFCNRQNAGRMGNRSSPNSWRQDLSQARYAVSINCRLRVTDHGVPFEDCPVQPSLPGFYWCALTELYKAVSYGLDGNRRLLIKERVYSWIPECII